MKVFETGRFLQGTALLERQDQTFCDLNLKNKSLITANLPDRCTITFTRKIPVKSGNKILYIKYCPLKDVRRIKSRNFNEQWVVKITENAYRGGRPKNEEAIIALKELGVKTVIAFIKEGAKFTDEIHNMEEEKKLVEKHGMKFVQISLDETKDPGKKEIKKFLKQWNDGPIYFHCNAGQDRTGIMGAIADIEKFGMSFNQAYARMLSQNHDFNYHYNLDAFLYVYCLKKGEKPENMHPKEILEYFVDKNYWIKDECTKYKETVINDVVVREINLAKAASDRDITKNLSIRLKIILTKFHAYYNSIKQEFIP